MRMQKTVLRTGPFVIPLAVLALLLAAASVQTAPPTSLRFTTLVSETKQHVRLISAARLKAQQEAASSPIFLIDVREDTEWADGHLPGAVHLGKGVIERDIEKLVSDPAAEIVLYCTAGSRSILAADSLQKMGYTNVLSLDGGMRAWLDAGDPVVKK